MLRTPLLPSPGSGTACARRGWVRLEPTEQWGDRATCGCNGRDAGLGLETAGTGGNRVHWEDTIPRCVPLTSREAQGQSCLLSLPLQVSDVRAAQRFKIRVHGQFAGYLGAGVPKLGNRTKFRVQKAFAWGWQTRYGLNSTALGKNVHPFHRWESCPQGHGACLGSLWGDIRAVGGPRQWPSLSSLLL